MLAILKSWLAAIWWFAIRPKMWFAIPAFLRLIHTCYEAGKHAGVAAAEYDQNNLPVSAESTKEEK